MTAESTMMPKSTAPTESRLALSPIITSKMVAKNSAKGMFNPTMIALRRLPRKIHWIRKTSRHPKTRLCRTVCVVMRDQRRTVVERNNLYSARKTAVAIQRLDRLLDLGNHVGGFFRSPLHHDCADNVVVRVAAQNAEPWPVAHRNRSDILHQNRNAVLLAQNDILDVVHL